MVCFKKAQHILLHSYPPPYLCASFYFDCIAQCLSLLRKSSDSYDSISYHIYNYGAAGRGNSHISWDPAETRLRRVFVEHPPFLFVQAENVFLKWQ